MNLSWKVVRLEPDFHGDETGYSIKGHFRARNAYLHIPMTIKYIYVGSDLANWRMIYCSIATEAQVVTLSNVTKTRLHCKCLIFKLH